MQHLILPSKVVACLLFAMACGVGGLAHSQPHQAVLTSDAASGTPGQKCGPYTAADGQRLLILFVAVKSKASQTDRDALTAYLAKPGTYAFRSDWPGADNLLEFSGENPPFLLIEKPHVQLNDPEVPGFYKVCLLGALKLRSRGELEVKAPPADLGWKLARAGDKPDDLTVRYSTGNDWTLPPFRAKAQMGIGGGGPTLDVSGSGVLGTLTSKERSEVTTLSLAAKVPLGTPTDVKDVDGAEKDASGKVPDMLSLELNSTGYSDIWGLRRTGLRARATGSAKGLEITAYYAPLTLWLDGSHAFIGAEAETGWRKGDAEFKDLTTKAPDRGNFVARLGAVAEWAPEFLGVNRDLSRGLRFFMRGRGWLDVYDNDYGKRSVRFAPFVDSEIFYNFQTDTRLFLRGEYGSLPPDLTRRSGRVYLGVGQAF